jgi:hypothetical protein
MFEMSSKKFTNMSPYFKKRNTDQGDAEERNYVQLTKLA